MNTSAFLFTILFTAANLTASGQVINILYHPTEPPPEYMDNFHHTSIRPYGAYGLASFEVNPWIYDQRSQVAYRVMEVEGGCALLAVFRDYMEFVGNKTLCVGTPAHNETLHIVDVLVTGGQYLLIYSLQDKVKQENTLYVQELTPELALMGTPRKLFTMTAFVGDGLTVVRTSPNKRYVAFIQGDPDYSLNKNHRRPRCTIFDRNFNVVWQKDFDFSVYDGLLADIELDNAGNLHILRGPIAKDFQPGMHSYFWRSKRQVDVTLGREAHTNFGCKLKVIKGVAMVAGFYKERRSIGYFIYQADTTSAAVVEADRVMLPDQKDVSRSLLVREMAGLASGDLVFSAEWDVCSANGPHTLCASGPVTVVSWNGGHRWQRTLYKNQSSNDKSRGYTMIPFGDMVLFLYNDHPDNILKAPTDRDVARYHSTNSIVMMQKLDRDGRAIKEIVTLPRGSSRHRLVASGFPPIVPGWLYKVKVLEGGESLDGVLEVSR